MTFWVTGDLHLSHKTLINVRGLGKNHDKILIDEINKCVKENDILYHVGDFAPRNSAKYIADLIERINCNRIHFIKGNHDQKLGEALTFFHDGRKKLTLKENDKISVSDSENNSYNFYLNHYPLFSWPGSGFGKKNITYHLYGHCHGNKEIELNKLFPNRKSIDIGIDNYLRIYGKYRPFSLKEIINSIDNKN